MARQMSGGLGARRTADDSRWGAVEILDLRPALATMAAERAIRTQASMFAEAGIVRSDGLIAPVLDVRRVHDTLSVFTPHPDGARIVDVLAAVEQGTLALTDDAVLDLSGAVVRAVAWLHERSGAPSHGALSPSHVVLGRDGAIMLSDAVFATALQTLQWNRDRCWRECGLTLPAAATPPQFDQRADVAEVGGVVLAILLRRPLRVEDYAAIPELVMAATARLPMGSALRAWLQQSLHLHPKLTFGSAVEAWPALSAALTDAGRPPARSRSVLRQVIAGLAGKSLSDGSDLGMTGH